jgi:putative ABC transport system permease protein
MKEKVLSEFEALGTNKIFISPHWRDKDRRRAWANVVFKNSDFDQLLERCPSVASFTRDAGFGNLAVTHKTRTEEERVLFNSIDPDWHVIERRATEFGRPMSAMDQLQARRVCLINAKLRDQLNLDRDPTGQFIDVYFFGRMMVIGMIEKPLGMTGGEADTGRVYVPFSFATHKFPWPLWYGVTATSKSSSQTEEAKAEIEFYLRQKRRIRPGEEDNFRVNTAQRELEKFNEIAAIVTAIAVGIVAISLLVGGIGIMNIMLVSVSERTREIGLRKSVGARPAAILLQFLVEAVVLCLLGGALGLLLGQGLTTGVASLLPEDAKMDRLFLPATAVMLAFGFSVTVGLIFGMFPAIKAASLDPIEALRHE